MTQEPFYFVERCVCYPQGRGFANKVPFVAAVSMDVEGHPTAMNMAVGKGFRLTEIARWATQRLQSASTIVSDGLPCFSAFATL